VSICAGCAAGRAHSRMRVEGVFRFGKPLESRPKASARLDLEVSAGWASSFARGLWGGVALLPSSLETETLMSVCVWVVCVCAAGSSPPPSTISCPLPPPPPPPPPPLLPPPVSAPCNPAPQAVRGGVHGYGRTQTAYQQPTPCDCRELVYANSSTSRRIESKCSRSTPPLWVLCVTEPCSFTLLRWSSESPVSLSAV
jgi:hypothetical protein